ncbi:hypothetical protein DQ237_15185 [Blastococcus sp. TF02-8]|nr:hypothetical protein DQ237_15185 [Blastococcus sp. TF02-8]
MVWRGQPISSWLEVLLTELAKRVQRIELVGEPKPYLHDPLRGCLATGASAPTWTRAAVRRRLRATRPPPAVVRRASWECSCSHRRMACHVVGHGFKTAPEQTRSAAARMRGYITTSRVMWPIPRPSLVGVE